MKASAISLPLLGFDSYAGPRLALRSRLSRRALCRGRREREVEFDRVRRPPPFAVCRAALVIGDGQRMFGAKHSVRFDVGIAGNIQCGNQWLVTVGSDYKVDMRRTIGMTPLSAKQHSH